jgi:hypothetical protein
VLVRREIDALEKTGLSGQDRLPLRYFRFRERATDRYSGAVGRHLPRNRKPLCGHNGGGRAAIIFE